MEQYYLGIDASKKFTRLMLIDDTAKVINRCKIGVGESIAEAEKRFLFRNLEDSAMLLGIGATGTRRYSLPFKTDTALSETFALALAGKNYLPNVKTIIFSGAEKYEIIIFGDNNIEDFCSVNKKNIDILKKINISEPVLLLGSNDDYSKLKSFIKNITVSSEGKEYFLCFGACLAVRNSVGKGNVANYKCKVSGNEMNFKTLNCNGCSKHCVIYALIFNGQIKATFGAGCANPKVYDNIYLKKI